MLHGIGINGQAMEAHIVEVGVLALKDSAERGPAARR